MILLSPYAPRPESTTTVGQCRRRRACCRHPACDIVVDEHVAESNPVPSHTCKVDQV
jgi:hypothetical protein